MKPKVSIIIVQYRNKKVLKDCLKSIKKNVTIKHQVIVVDNDQNNIGFGAGCNKGSKIAQADYLFFLNPDTIILNDCLEKLVQFLDQHQTVSAVAPLLLDKNKKVYPIQGTNNLTPLRGAFAFSFINKYFKDNPISKSYWINVTGLTKPIKAQVLPGSAFLIRKKVFNQFKGFDPNFFLYFEESDLFYRMTKKGHQLYILPQAKLIHLWGKSTPKSAKIRKIFNQSRFYYFKKHFGLLEALLVELFV